MAGLRYAHHGLRILVTALAPALLVLIVLIIGNAPVSPAVDDVGAVARGSSARSVSIQTAAQPQSTFQPPGSAVSTDPMRDGPPAQAAGNEPFGLTTATVNPAYAVKWHAAMAAIAADLDVVARCRLHPKYCPVAARRFIDMVDVARGREGLARIGEINRALNLAIRFVRDAGPGGADQWASPLATLSAGQGDCEDYAIAKYMALRDLGIAAHDLRLVIVRDLRLRQDHALLAARLDTRWLVLDNQRLLLLDDQTVPGYAAIVALRPEATPNLAAAGVAHGPHTDAHPTTTQERRAAGVNPS